MTQLQQETFEIIVKKEEINRTVKTPIGACGNLIHTRAEALFKKPNPVKKQKRQAKLFVLKPPPSAGPSYAKPK